MQESINVFVDTMVSLGLKDVIISPGSRNAPLILAFSRIREINIYSVIDERSAGYTALGMSMLTGRPTALVCTSGTAAVNYYPSVTEAYYSRVPLLIITADRPGRMIDQWVGQSIRQDNLFSNHIRAEFRTPEDYSDTGSFINIAKEAFQKTDNPCPGPVHVNVPLNEPLYDAGPKQTAKVSIAVTGPNVHVKANNNDGLKNFISGILPRYRKVMVLFGAPESFGRSGQMTHRLPDSKGYVILPDIISGLPSPEGLEHWDAFLQNKWSGLNSLKPDLIVSYGTHCLSKGLSQFIKRFKPKEHFHFSEIDGVGDPFETHPVQLAAGYSELKRMLEENPKEADYLEHWKSDIKSWKLSFDKLPWEQFNEFTVTRYLLDHLNQETILHFSNSMPVRYGSFLNANNKFRLFSNRGTSGIDGCTSTALGYAIKSDKDVVLITGDIAFFYDINGLWRNSLPQNFKIILLNNEGGGIFDLIEGPSKHSVLAGYQQTPVALSANILSKAYGLTYFRASDFNELEQQFINWESFNGPSLLEIETKKEKNKSFYSKFTGNKL